MRSQSGSPVSAPPVTFLVLAAGGGKRMRSELPKPLHEICGKPLITWVLEAVRNAGASRVIVVDGPQLPLRGVVGEHDEVVIQQEPLGTGDAVKAAAPVLDPDGIVVVLYGDVPLVSPQTLRELIETHTREHAAATIATMTVDNPKGYGRILRGDDRRFVRIVEESDASEAERDITDVNTGMAAFDGAALRAALDRLRPTNAQGELYLTDAFAFILEAGHRVATYKVADPSGMLGINDRVDLETARKEAQRRILDRLRLAGVTIVGEAFIDAEVEIGQDTTIFPGAVLRGSTRIGRGSTIGPFAVLIDTQVGDGVSVGPFVSLRRDTVLEDGSKAGTFVEVKNATVGPGAKVPHLSYVGDATIGAGTNIGAGTITCNYDGVGKNRTEIGDDVFIGSNTLFVAPVSVGDGAITAAGSVITENVPADALGIARARQNTRAGWAPPHWERLRSRGDRGIAGAEDNPGAE